MSGVMTAAEGQLTDQLAHGHAVPGGPGACARPGCGHAKVWHNPRNRVRECERCGCRGFTDQVASTDTGPLWQAIGQQLAGWPAAVGSE